MAAEPPLTRVVLAASSVADDLGYVALAGVLGTSTYRIIGGHMVTALVARWQLGAALYRETGDTDLGVPPVVVRKEGVIRRLIERGYEQVEGTDSHDRPTTFRVSARRRGPAQRGRRCSRSVVPDESSKQPSRVGGSRDDRGGVPGRGRRAHAEGLRVAGARQTDRRRRSVAVPRGRVGRDRPASSADWWRSGAGRSATFWLITAPGALGELGLGSA